MSAPGGYFFTEIALFTITNCQPFALTWMATVLALTRYTPQVITFLMYFIGLFRKEIYLLVFGVGLSLDSTVGVLIGELVDVAPRVESCAPVHSAAVAYQVQHGAFFITFALGYMSLYRPRVKFWHLSLIVLFFVAVVVGAHLLNYYSSEAILSGAALGSMNAFIYQSLVHWLLVPYFPVFLCSRFNRYWCYADNLCTGIDKPPLHVLLVEAYDRFVDAERAAGRWRCDEHTCSATRKFIASQVY